MSITTKYTEHSILSTLYTSMIIDMRITNKADSSRKSQ